MRRIEKLVVDANVLLSIVIGGKGARRVVNHPCAPILYATPDVHKEVEEYIPILSENKKLKKKGLTLNHLYSVWAFVPVRIAQAPKESEAWNVAKRYLGNRDPDDIPTAALALYLNCPIWSQDKDFDEVRSFLQIYNTGQLIDLLDTLLFEEEC
ncbi:MAG TPA: PIN domain-containing protein [Calditerricola sp.]